MTESEQQIQSERFEQAVERKNAEARERAEASSRQAEEASLERGAPPQDESDVRAKSSGHGKQTADKWNQ